MAPVKKRYKDWICKGLLTSIYILFFAGQFNPRYYSIANFFVYSGQSSVTVAKALMTYPDGNHVQTTVLKSRVWTEIAHLGLDKRFHSKHFDIAFADREILIAPCYPLICGKCHLSVPDIVSTSPVIPSLRGPPVPDLTTAISVCV